MPLDALTQEVTLTPKGVKKTVRRIKRGLKDVDESAQDTTEELDEATGRFQRMGKAAKRWLAGVAAGAVTALAGVMAKATKEAVRFEERLRETATLLDGDVEATLGRFASGIDRIRRDLPVTTDLTQALYDAISAGVDEDNALQFLRTAAEAAVGGVTNTQTAVDALSSAINAYGKDITEAEEVSDSFFTAVDRGKTTFPELARVIGRVTPLAASLGIELDEVNAALATLTLSGQDTSEAATALRGVLAQLVKNGEKFRDMGVDLNRVLDEEGLLGVLRRVREETGGNTEAVQRLFQDVEGLNAVLSLAGPQAETFASIMSDMASKSGSTADAVDEVRKSVGALWKTTKNQLTVALRQLGENVLPTLNSVLRTTNALLSDAASSDLEQLLNSVQGIEGVDPAIPVQLRATIDLRQAREALEDVQDRLDDEITVGVNLDPDHPLGAVGRTLGLEAPDVMRETAAIDSLTREEIQQKLKAVNRELKIRARRMAELEEAGKDIPDDTRLTIQALRNAQQGLQEGLEVLSQYEAAQKAVSDAQNRLAGTFGGENQEQIRETIELLKELGEIESVDELVPMPSAEAGGGGDEFNMPDILNVQRMAPATREQARKLARQFVANLKRSVQQQVKSTGVEADVLDLMGIDPRDLKKDLDELLEAFDRGKISAQEFQQSAVSMAREYRKELERAIDFLEENGLITPEVASAAKAELQEMKKEIQEAAAEAQELGEIFQDVARLVRGIGDLASAFGDISDEAETAIRSTASVMDNIGRILELMEDLPEGQGFFDLFTDNASTALSAATTMVGALGALVQLGTSIGSAVFGRDGKTQEEIAKLNRQIDSQIRALRENTEALRRERVVGGDIQGETVQEALGLVSDLRDALEEPGGLFGGGTPVLEEGTSPSEVLDLLQTLEDTGIEAFEGIVEIWETETERGVLTPGQILNKILGELGPAINQLEDAFGSFGDSVQGIIEELRVRRDLLGQEAGTLLDVLTGRLSDVGFSDELTSTLVEMLSDVDLSDGDAVKELVKQLTQLLVQGPQAIGLQGSLEDLLGEATPDAFRSLIETIQSMFGGEGGESPGDQFSTQAAVSRTITEFQANELLAFQQELVQLGRRHGDLLAGILSELGGDPGATLAAARSAVDVPSASQLRAFESSLRSRPRRAGGGGQAAQPVVVNSDAGGSTSQTFNVHIDVSAQETPESIARKMDEAVGSFLNRRRV